MAMEQTALVDPVQRQHRADFATSVPTDDGNMAVFDDVAAMLIAV
jgi:hypothetical protein